MSPTTPENEVLAANSAFYGAIASGDLSALRTLWSSRHLVVCMHPGWQTLHGRRQVLASWRAIFESSGAPPIRCQDARAFVIGAAAFVTCVEMVDGTRLEATNVFALEDEGWKLVHHHAGQSSFRASGLLDASEDLN